MLIGEGLPFIREFVEAINAAIKQTEPEKSLSKLQRAWLSFVIMGVLVTNSVCWSRFERYGAGRYKQAAQSWMFRRAKLAWDMLLEASVLKIIERYNIRQGVLVIDDTDRRRAKRTSAIGKAHKIRDKKTGGYINGQSLVFLLLVSDSVTVPVGFVFYEPDPTYTAWRKEDERLKAQGVAKKHRPNEPERSEEYPTKKALALTLLSRFKAAFGTIKIRATVADQLYSHQEFIDKAHEITGQKQIITQIRKNQLIMVNGQYIKVSDFFSQYQGHTTQMSYRLGEKTLTYRGACFKVKSHGQKYFIIALRYEGETDYRYVIANDMSWRLEDIIHAFALRWLVEVFFQDWKLYEGWNQMAKQTGVEGSERSLILSLLCDHALLLHQEQLALFEHKEPAATVGSLREKVLVEALSDFMKNIVEHDDPKRVFEEYAQHLSELFQLRTSIKHMRGMSFEHLQPQAS